MDKINMSQLVEDAKEKDESEAKRKLAAQQQTYDNLLFHIEDFAYLSDRVPPALGKPPPIWTTYGHFTFTIGVECLKVRCDWNYYVLFSKKVGDNRWNGGREMKDVAEVCQLIAEWTARSLGGEADKEQPKPRPPADGEYQGATNVHGEPV